MSDHAINKQAAWFKSIPWYGIIIGLAFTLGLQTLMYSIGVNLIPHEGFFKGYDPQITAIDGAIPLIPYVFVQFYAFWYVFFPIGVIISSAKINQGKNKQEWINLIISWSVAIFIGGLILIFFPSYIERKKTAGVPGLDVWAYIKDKHGLSWWFLKNWIHEDQVYEYGCVPSFHCLQIIFCYLAVARRKDKHIAHRLGWLVIAIMTCLATVFCKQHYIVDVFTALPLALISFFVVKSFNPGKAILRKCPNFLIIKKLNWSHERIYKKTNKS